MDPSVSDVSPVLKDGITPNPAYIDQVRKNHGETNSTFEKAAADLQPQTGDPFAGIRNAGMKIPA